MADYIVLEEKNERRWVNSKMPMLMLQCRTCGEVFPGIYIPEGSTNGFKASATNADTSHTCSRGHNNEYATADYMDWSWLPLKSTKVIVVTYPDSFRLEEAKSLVESADSQIVKVVTQKYLNHSEYGVGSGKAEEIKQFALECKDAQIVVDEHLTSRQIHNLEKLTGAQVIDREINT